MSTNKTQPTDSDPHEFIASIENNRRREDAQSLLALMTEVTNEQPVMWGQSIIGFGRYHYRYATGREGDFLKQGFSPRKANLSIYCMAGAKKYPQLLNELGPHKTGAACLYVTRLDKINIDVLRQILISDWNEMTQKYG